MMKGLFYLLRMVPLQEGQAGVPGHEQSEVISWEAKRKPEDSSFSCLINQRGIRCSKVLLFKGLLQRKQLENERMDFLRLALDSISKRRGAMSWGSFISILKFILSYLKMRQKGKVQFFEKKNNFKNNGKVIIKYL